jgi:cytoskeleton protein RodZ
LPADPNATAINTAELQSAADNRTDTTDTTDTKDTTDTTVAPEAALPVVTQETTTVATSAEGAVSLMLSFSAECWVEIADSKRSLLYGLKKAGAVAMLEGIPPFKLFLGNRQAVQIELAGRPYAIPAGPPDAGNTARFTIEEVPLQ